MYQPKRLASLDLADFLLYKKQSIRPAKRVYRSAYRRFTIAKVLSQKEVMMSTFSVSSLTNHFYGIRSAMQLSRQIFLEVNYNECEK